MIKVLQPISIKSIKIIHIVEILLLLQCCFSALPSFPISIATVRSISTGINFDQYLAAIGTIKTPNNNITGYNIIALDGFKSTTTQSNINLTWTPLSAWCDIFNKIQGKTPNAFGSNSKSTQMKIKSSFEVNNSLLLAQCFSNQLKIYEKNVSIVSDNLIKILKNNNLDGVIIQWIDFRSDIQGQGSIWLFSLLTNLKRAVPDIYIVLSISVTLLGKMSIFHNSQINSFIDIYSLKYYNILTEQFATYNTIFSEPGSTTYPQTSIKSILKSPIVQIDACKIVIEKPAVQQDAWNPKQYISATIFDQFASKAYDEYGWFGGYSNPNFKSDQQLSYVKSSLATLREKCKQSLSCFCEILDLN